MSTITVSVDIEEEQIFDIVQELKKSMETSVLARAHELKFEKENASDAG